MNHLLPGINDPGDLKSLSAAELEALSSEIRQNIIEVVSDTGGHLGSNLGVVELTVALHRIFNSPDDKIIWDVGHQCYTHKILTGRKNSFHTLRQPGGICGFPRREESPHDHFNTGHTSTSISMALGLSKAGELCGKNNHYIAVIGDGAMTGGMAFEALNHAGHIGANIIIVLNDNTMSISPNVGAMSRYLNQMRMAPTYKKLREDIDGMIARIPAIGPTMWLTTQKLEKSIKQLLVHGMLFETLGFTYLGPFDGHNIPLLLETFEKAKTMKGPRFIHVLTKKGKGYIHAEQDPTCLHGTSPFHIETGKPRKKKVRITYSESFGKSLVKMAEKDSSIVAITAAMPDGTGLSDFARKFPHRFFDVGIAEQHAVSLASGLAANGARPVVAIYSTFLQRAFDQIILDVCLSNLPVTFCLDRAGLVGDDGPTHHGVFDISYLRCIPNLTIMSPKDEDEMQDMLYTALKHDGPCAIRYPRSEVLGVPVKKNPEAIPYGKGEILKDGRSLVIMAAGNMVRTALDAAVLLEKEDISTKVINLRFIKPLDEELILNSAIECKHIITVEDNVLAGGLGSEVMEVLERNEIDNIKLSRTGIPDSFIDAGSTKILYEKCGLYPAGIANKAKKMLSREISFSVRERV
ncbi:MAG: 1-deoxy-D-xylulose-5-phosphate synthase [Candidatus Eremiobacterota bacterium]